MAALKALERAATLSTADADVADSRLQASAVRLKLGMYDEALGTHAHAPPGAPALRQGPDGRGCFSVVLLADVEACHARAAPTLYSRKLEADIWWQHSR